jgi:hypothetical protein
MLRHNPNTFALFTFKKQFFFKFFRGGKIYFGLQFQGLQSIVGWLHCFCAVVRQNIRVARKWGGERKRGRGRRV